MAETDRELEETKRALDEANTTISEFASAEGAEKRIFGEISRLFVNLGLAFEPDKQTIVEPDRTK